MEDLWVACDVACDESGSYAAWCKLHLFKLASCTCSSLPRTYLHRTSTYIYLETCSLNLCHKLNNLCHESYTFMKTSITHQLSILDLKSSKMSAYLIRTSGVPLSYHHLQNVEKTKGLHVPLEYHYSTSIFHFDPKTTIDKISTTS